MALLAQVRRTIQREGLAPAGTRVLVALSGGADSVALLLLLRELEDQAETFLLRLLRGAGTRGLAAIRPRAGRVIRPLLEIERDALRSYLAQRQQPFRNDSSNADVTFARNRVRHELIPLLQSRF